MGMAKNDKLEVFLARVSTHCYSSRAVTGENGQVCKTVMCLFHRQRPKDDGRIILKWFLRKGLLMKITNNRIQ